MNQTSASPPMIQRVVLAARPEGAPKTSDFRLETVARAVPVGGEVVIKNRYLSLDPYMRGRMNAGPSYAPAVELNAVMVGGTVAEVIESQHPDFQAGDWVLSQTGWQTEAIAKGESLTKLPRGLKQPSLALSLLGMPGFTAWHGLLQIGKPRPGDTVVVASATGAVGSMVGQLAKRAGAYVVGIAGGADKCTLATDQLGFEHCLDRHASDFTEQLAAATPQGIDIYFENVGGAVFDAVLPRLNVGARIPLCGLIAQYNGRDQATMQDRLPDLMLAALAKRITIQGFIISDHYADEYAAFMQDLWPSVESGEIRGIEQVIHGLEQAPQGLIDLLAGQYAGKLIVDLSH